MSRPVAADIVTNRAKLNIGDGKAFERYWAYLNQPVKDTSD
jgi:hypothetical protein